MWFSAGSLGDVEKFDASFFGNAHVILISYFGIDADQLMQSRPELTSTLFTEVMALFTQGIFNPLPYRVFEAEKGARHLVLLSRSGPGSNEANMAIERVQQHGVQVHAASCDIIDKKALALLLATIARKMPPLKGTMK